MRVMFLKASAVSVLSASDERGVCLCVRVCYMCVKQDVGGKRQRGTEKANQSGHRHPDETETTDTHTHTVMIC